MIAPNPGDIYESPDGKLWLLLRADKTSALLLVGDGTHGTPTVYLSWTELTGTFRPGGVSGLHRGARAICHYLGMRPGGYITGYHRMLFDTAADLLASPRSARAGARTAIRCARAATGSTTCATTKATTRRRAPARGRSVVTVGRWRREL